MATDQQVKAVITKFMECFEMKQKLKEKSKENDMEFKSTSEVLESFLSQQPNGLFPINENITLKLRERKKPVSCNNKFIGDCYVEFQRQSLKRKDVTPMERDSFLDFMKIVKQETKKETVRDITVVTNK